MIELKAVAHRGDSENFTENSIASYEGAIKCGADFIEADARQAADGEIVCCHDPDLNRIAGIDKLISDCRLDELMDTKIDDSQTLQSLRNVLQLAKDRIEVLVDIKTTDLDVVEGVFKLVQEQEMFSSVVFGVRDLEQLIYLEGQSYTTRCLGLVGNYNDVITFFENGAEAVRIWEDDLNQPNAQKALKEKKTVWVTAGFRSKGEAPGFITTARLKGLQQLGVTAVLLNNPSLVTGT